MERRVSMEEGLTFVTIYNTIETIPVESFDRWIPKEASYL